ncbi:MAG: hypothetical protein JO181_17500 [Solirubrobacterales bacterium]|nr:hypothetical protein [Solirubrobacterales bacterium]
MKGVVDMRFSKRRLFTVLSVAITALSVAFAAGAVGASGHASKANRGTRSGNRSKSEHRGRFDHRGRTLIKESLAPSQPTDPTFHGVKPGGAPWILKRGEVRLESTGRLDLVVRGLVIPTTGTAGPVTTISASLYCGADSNTTAAVTTQSVPITSTGNARIRASLTVPSTCLAPVILVNPNGNAGIYIALDGWRL